MIPADAPGQPAYWRDACAALAADPVMAQLMARYPEAQLSSRGEPFVTLVRAIVGQQISTRAADAVWARLLAAVPQLSPEALLAHAPDALRAVGLSARKVEYAHDLARHFAEGRIDPARFQALDDETLIAELVAVRGIGRWTAEMFLIFNQLRADVWPVDDIGLQRAVSRHYLAGDTPTPKALRAFGQRFAPWRTVATWYLWRSLDPETVLY
ncbi:DNA-3-methyladenine glycosylase 2 family protein [Rivihabitans pingtungensis]|jgi:DNA-3-methyladenine glycosylase II|uniref:DNA-3-methyladenine glycosylase family protein n=1 Tax=Rivihabitans pingtungensis TaxID=1054498 RepID=UPI0028A1D5CA|nr:DNA-3-methyladenine glycosylase 2 family protein [Rivihabitans pingtungensis]